METLETLLTNLGIGYKLLFIFTTIILSLAFLVFVFSDFNPNYHFGVVTATALVIAVLVDLVALPALLSKIDDREKSLLL